MTADGQGGDVGSRLPQSLAARYCGAAVIRLVIYLHATVAPGSTQQSSTNSGNREVPFIFLFLAFGAHLFHWLPLLSMVFGVHFVLNCARPSDRGSSTSRV